MAQLIFLPTITDERGSLSVAEKDIPFSIRRVFYIYDVTGARGGHGHLRTHLALICVSGSVQITTVNKLDKTTQVFQLQKASQCLLLEPNDWHTMENFSKGSTLIVLASEGYDPTDYFYEKPQIDL